MASGTVTSIAGFSVRLFAANNSPIPTTTAIPPYTGVHAPKEPDAPKDHEKDANNS